MGKRREIENTVGYFVLPTHHDNLNNESIFQIYHLALFNKCMLVGLLSNITSISGFHKRTTT